MTKTVVNKPVVNKAIALVPVVLLTASGCAVGARASAPTCGSAERLALLAQSVPTAAYVPCLHALPQGWSVTRAQAARGSARIVLLSDRSDGHSVDVRLSAGCDVTGSTAAVPHADGVHSFIRVTSIRPLYAGELYDVFSGGCVRYRFAFPRGPHIPLMDELSASVGLVPRQDVRLALRHALGVRLDP